MITLTFVIWVLIFIALIGYLIWATNEGESLDALASCGGLIIIVVLLFACVLTWEVNGFAAVFSLPFLLLSSSLILGVLMLPPIVMFAFRLFSRDLSISFPSLKFKKGENITFSSVSILQLIVSIIGLIASILGIIQYFSR